MVFVGLTWRAIRDLEEIERYSIERWGRRVAEEYQRSIEASLERLRERPELLRAKGKASRHFLFYRVRQHFLVCIVRARGVYVLTIKHGGMDLASRLAEIEPQLLYETELFEKALAKREVSLASSAPLN